MIVQWGWQLSKICVRVQPGLYMEAPRRWQTNGGRRGSRAGKGASSKQNREGWCDRGAATREFSKVGCRRVGECMVVGWREVWAKRH